LYFIFKLLFVLAVLFILWVISVAILIVYYFYFFKISINTDYSHQKQAISVVICARNEANNLLENTPLICNQNYENFEVIVVDDASNDNTRNVLKDLQATYKNLKVITIIDKNTSYLGKKFALKNGISAANNELILLTDADCKPTSEYWIQHMANALQPNDEVVLGYGAYANQQGFLNDIIKAETFYTALLYFSFAAKGLPYMGVGRNLLYRKSFFYKSNGLHNYKHIASGDDDLLLQDAMSADKVAICYQPESHTISPPPYSWSAWYNQKKRHLSTSFHYPRKIIYLLSIFNCSVLIFIGINFILFIYSFINPAWFLQAQICISVLACNAIISILCDISWLSVWRANLLTNQHQNFHKNNHLNLFHYAIYLFIHIFTLILPKTKKKW
jgi:glycosyltransferase involved in cell wall biosynthesis